MSPPTPSSPVSIQPQEQNNFECKVMKTANGNFETHSQEAEIHSFVKEKLFIKTDESLFIV